MFIEKRRITKISSKNKGKKMNPSATCIDERHRALVWMNEFNKILDSKCFPLLLAAAQNNKKSDFDKICSGLGIPTDVATAVWKFWLAYHPSAKMERVEELAAAPCW